MIQQQTPWRLLVSNALKSLNGKAHLNQIYEIILEKPNRKLYSNWKARVRATLEENSSDSEAYLGKEDIFKLVEKGKGIWALRDYHAQD